MGIQSILKRLNFFFRFGHFEAFGWGYITLSAGIILAACGATEKQTTSVSQTETSEKVTTSTVQSSADEDPNAIKDYVLENAALNTYRLPLKKGFKIITWPSRDALYSEQHWDEYEQINKENPIRLFNVDEERKCKWIKLYTEDRTEVIQIKSNLCNFDGRRGEFQAFDENIKAKNLNFFSHCITEKVCDITTQIWETPDGHALIPESRGYRYFAHPRSPITNYQAFILKSEDKNLILYNKVWGKINEHSSWYGYSSDGISIILSSTKTPTQSQLYDKINDIITAN